MASYRQWKFRHGPRERDNNQEEQSWLSNGNCWNSLAHSDHLKYQAKKNRRAVWKGIGEMSPRAKIRTQYSLQNISQTVLFVIDSLVQKANPPSPHARGDGMIEFCKFFVMNLAKQHDGTSTSNERPICIEMVWGGDGLNGNNAKAPRIHDATVKTQWETKEAPRQQPERHSEDLGPEHHRPLQKGSKNATRKDKRSCFTQCRCPS